MTTEKKLSHIAGTFVIQADGAFLNGAGLGQGEDRNTTIPKTLMDGKNRIPYVSAQSWRRWLRNTLIEETGWSPSEMRAIKFNAKGNTSKVSGEIDPVNFAEDDIFGYMRTSADDAESKDGDDEGALDAGDAEPKESTPVTNAKVKSVMRPSPFASSLLIAIRRNSRPSTDNGYVYPINGTPLPYSTQFYVANMQAVFCLDYSRLGVFRNVGDRIELAEEFIQPKLNQKHIEIVEDFGKKGRVYAMTNKMLRKTRTTELLKALAVLRGGAKQAQFGTDVSPKAIIAAGLTCGNPIFNHLFDDEPERGIILKTDALREIVTEYADRITTPIYIGIRTGFLANEGDVRKLQTKADDGKNEVAHKVSFVVCTPREAMQQLAGHLL